MKRPLQIAHARVVVIAFLLHAMVRQVHEIVLRRVTFDFTLVPLGGKSGKAFAVNVRNERRKRQNEHVEAHVEFPSTY